MANIKFTNLASSTLQTAINTTATIVTVAAEDVAKFPVITGSEYFVIVLVNSDGDFEIMRVVGMNSNSFTVVRAQEGTPARAFSIGDKVEHRLTAESLVTVVEEASITKPHTSTDADTYGHATSTLFSHVKITDETNSSATSVLGIGVSPYAIKTRFDQLLGASAQVVMTTSSSFIVPETGVYEVTCVGGGGAGGTGGTGYVQEYYGECGSMTPLGCWSLSSGGGAGGGGAGQVVTNTITLTKGTSIPVTIGASGGATSFGTYLTALAGSRGNNGSAPSSGTGGYSYGSVANSGNAGVYRYGLDVGIGRVSGGSGGNGGISTEGTYGNGGRGGNGGDVYFYDATSYSNASGSVGISGVQGCVKIRLVLGS